MEEVSPGIRVVALPSPTLFPATHTNCYIIGNGAVSVVDPPSVETPDVLKASLKPGERPQRVILTHHHHDHIGGAMAMVQRFAIPVVAHRNTRALLLHRVEVDELVTDGAMLECGGLTIAAHHTPGHAPGHLVLMEQKSKVLIAGDMVAGIGTVVVGAQHGDLGQYLASLDLMRSLKPSMLLPAHGAPLLQADSVLAFYIAHRHQRTEQIRSNLDKMGRSTPLELVPQVYPEIPRGMHMLAAEQVLSHLRWMKAHAMVHSDDETSWELCR